MKRSLFLAGAALAAAFNNGEPMKLINKKTGFIVVEFNQGQVKFYDRFLEGEMKETGIWIPEIMRDQFENKEVIFLGEPLFQKAFIEVYYPLCIAQVLYEWE